MLRSALLALLPLLAHTFLLPGAGAGGCGCAQPQLSLPPPPQLNLPQPCLPPPPQLSLPPPPQLHLPQPCLPPAPQLSLPPPPQISLPPPPSLALPSLPGGCGCGRKKRSAHESPIRCSEIVEVIEQELDQEDTVKLAQSIEKKLISDFKAENVAVSCSSTKSFSLIPLEGKRTCASGNQKITCVVYH